VNTVFLGVDVGSTYCKSAVLNKDKELIGYHIVRSGTSFEEASRVTAEASLRMAGYTMDNVEFCVTTGYGRDNVVFSNRTVSEISCHSKTTFEKYSKELTLIDIGGQDSKVIFIDKKGKRINFIMNRKCAAGTGSFIEEMALRLGVRIDDMDKLARSSDRLVQLGSFCTVFAGTEILSKIRGGESVENLAKGIFYSVLKRITAMGSFKGNIVMTGGAVANNPYLVDMMNELTDCEILLPTHPQLFGAIGAALYAIDFSN
jgi:(R)-2-hydroxyacyl-CoA dehydratese activating ATPase